MEEGSYYERMEGQREAAAFIINNMMEEGISTDLIAKITRLEKHEIRSLLWEQSIKERKAARLRLIEELTGLSPDEIDEWDKKPKKSGAITENK